MKKTRWGLLVGGICIAAFVGGVVSGIAKSNAGKSDDEKVKSVAVDEETLSRAEKETDYYELVVKGDYIFLREVFSDNTSADIEMSEINTLVLPEDDIRLLERGIAFPDKDEALMMMESFVS